MKNNGKNNKLDELIERLVKFKGAKTVKHKGLENLDSAIETIKECVSKDKLIGYMVVGLTNSGNSVQTVEGSGFAAYEMINLLFGTIAKIDTDLGRAILEKLESNFEEIETSKPEDEKYSDNDCDKDDEDDDDEDVKKEVAEEIKNILAKCFDIDFEDFNKNEQ